MQMPRRRPSTTSNNPLGGTLNRCLLAPHSSSSASASAFYSPALISQCQQPHWSASPFYILNSKIWNLSRNFQTTSGNTRPDDLLCGHFISSPTEAISRSASLLFAQLKSKYWHGQRHTQRQTDRRTDKESSTCATHTDRERDKHTHTHTDRDTCCSLCNWPH